MDFQIYLTYSLATTLLILLPGPIVSIIIANSLSLGPKIGLLTAGGAIIGTTILVSVSAYGMAWFLDFYSNWLKWVNYLGAAYLIYLGKKYWTNSVSTKKIYSEEDGFPQMAVLNGFLVALTNPKTVLFFAAFFPQFIDTSKPISAQLMIMTLTFVLLAILIDTSYAVLAGHLQSVIKNVRKTNVHNRISSLILIITGIYLIFYR